MGDVLALRWPNPGHSRSRFENSTWPGRAAATGRRPVATHVKSRWGYGSMAPSGLVKHPGSFAVVTDVAVLLWPGAGRCENTTVARDDRLMDSPNIPRSPSFLVERLRATAPASRKRSSVQCTAKPRCNVTYSALPLMLDSRPKRQLFDRLALPAASRVRSAKSSSTPAESTAGSSYCGTTIWPRILSFAGRKGRFHLAFFLLLIPCADCPRRHPAVAVSGPTAGIGRSGPDPR